MADRLTFTRLESDRSFVKELMHVPVNNRARLDVVSRALHEAIETELTPRQREIIELRYFEHMRGTDIAQRLGLHPSTVCRTAKRAEQRLYRALRFYVEYLNCASLSEE